MEGCLIPDFSSKPYEIYVGDALDIIRKLKAGGALFDCVVTSPPYFNQRKYGNDPKEIGRKEGEDSLVSYISALVGVFKEIPLRPWASIWVNIGDKRGSRKTLLGVPSRFIVAMQDGGFHLVDNVIWAKEVISVEGKNTGHCMVEPVKGRINGNGWESLLRFVVNPDKAWTDTYAIQVPRDSEHFFRKETEVPVQAVGEGESARIPIEQHPYNLNMRCVTSLEGRNIANVWYIGNSREGKGHFAAYPKELVERPIAMTCPEYLVDDGGETKPRVREVDSVVYSEGPGKSKRIFGQYSLLHKHREDSGISDEEAARQDADNRTKATRMDFARSYIPTYPRHRCWTHEDKPVAGPGIVFDPFGGTGTTGYVSVLLGRRFVGIDLYQEAVTRMEERCQKASEIVASSAPVKGAEKSIK